MIELNHVDVGCVSHCPKKCVSCSHASPYMKPWFMDVGQMVSDLNALKPFVHFNQVALVGGEPLLHPKLMEFIHAAKEVGIADEVCVVTNGMLLPKMNTAFWESLDSLRLSIYGNLNPDILPLAKLKAEIHGFRLDAWEYKEFFLQLKSKPDDGVESFNRCEWRRDCFGIHQGKFYLCPQSLHFSERFLGHESAAGLPLENLTEAKLRAYLDRTEPFEACSICCGGEKIAAPWREAKSKRDWLEGSTL